jgi:hypothetical protein
MRLYYSRWSFSKRYEMNGKETNFLIINRFNFVYHVLNAFLVRFIEQRKPVPPTRPPPPTTPPTQYVSSEPAYQSHQPYQSSHSDNPSWNSEVPQLLICDGSRENTDVCNNFCTYNIEAIRGVCNLTDYSCSCIGVPPAVVQDGKVFKTSTLR